MARIARFLELDELPEGIVETDNSMKGRETSCFYLLLVSNYSKTVFLHRIMYCQ